MVLAQQLTQVPSECTTDSYLETLLLSGQVLASKALTPAWKSVALRSTSFLDKWLLRRHSSRHRVAGAGQRGEGSRRGAATGGRVLSLNPNPNPNPWLPAPRHASTTGASRRRRRGGGTSCRRRGVFFGSAASFVKDAGGSASEERMKRERYYNMHGSRDRAVPPQ